MTSSGPVEIEDVLKAGHCVEPDKEMQSCANTVEAADANRMISNAGFIITEDFIRPRSSEEPISAQVAIAKLLIIPLLDT